MENLTEDLLFNIFEKLTLKALDICTCLNKEWRSLINSYKMKPKKVKYLIFWGNIKDHQLQLYVDNDNLDPYKTLTIPFTPFCDYPTPIAICNGVLCLADEYATKILLWNPIIHKLLTLPEPHFNAAYRNLISDFRLGFAFDSLRNDYKILKTLMQQGELRVEVFSLANNSWKDISEITPWYAWWEGLVQIFDGTLHCLVRGYQAYNDRSSAILEFDLNAEVFKEIELPPFFNEMRNMKLELYKESYLAICCCSTFQKCCLEIWLMREYGNTESLENIWKFDCEQIPFGLPSRVDGLGLRNNGEVWCSASWPSGKPRLISIDRNYIVKEPELEGSKRHTISGYRHMIYFEESLFLNDNVDAENCEVKKRMDYLTEDLLSNILHKLPAKSLGRCMLVNRKWHCLIKSTSFISSYIAKTNYKRGEYLLFWNKRFKRFTLLEDDNYEWGWNTNLPYIPFKTCSNGNVPNPLAICNGVLCLVDESSSDIVLWNPTIKKVLTLPKPNHSAPSYSDFVCFHLGFAYDSMSNDYKVLKIFSFLDDTEPPQVEIFSLNNNSWKDISESATSYHWQAENSPFFNEAIRCLCTLVYDDTSKSSLILGFDVNAEVIREIKLPHLFGERDIMALDMYKESNMGICCSFMHHEVRFLEIWVMKDYDNVESWEIICKYDTTQIPLLRDIGMHNSIRGLGFRNNGEAWCVAASPEKNRIFSIGLGDNAAELDHYVLDQMNFSHARIRYFVASFLLIDNVNAVNPSIARTTSSQGKKDKPVPSLHMDSGGDSDFEERLTSLFD